MKEIRLGPNDNSLPSHQTEPTKPIRELTAEEWYKERDSMTDLALKQSQIKTIEELRKEILSAPVELDVIDPTNTGAGKA